MRLPPWLLALSLAAPLALASPCARAAAPPPPVFDSNAWAESALAGVQGPADTLAADTARRAASPATRDYLAEARAAYTGEHRAYQGIRIALRFALPVASALAWLLLVFSGLATRFRDVAERASRRLWVQTLIHVALCGLAWAVLLLPLECYAGWAVERQFGVGTQSLPEWLFDHAKELAASWAAVALAPVAALAVQAIRRFPRTWWAWLAAGTLPVIAAGALLQPLVFDPLFNHFTPLPEGPLRTRLLALAARADVPAHDVSVADMSRQTRKLNAYVNGLGSTSHIVIWDTTLEAMADDEVAFVMAHEMGHYALAHVWKGLVLQALGAFVLFALAARILGWALARGGREWGVSGAGDLAALPLLAAIVGLLLVVQMPVENAVSRALEHEADVFALEITHDNDAGARSFLKLAAANLSDPEPPAWVRIALYTHPPLGDRIRFALGYRPWDTGEPNRAWPGGRAKR